MKLCVIKEPAYEFHGILRCMVYSTILLEVALFLTENLAAAVAVFAEAAHADKAVRRTNNNPVYLQHLYV